MPIIAIMEITSPHVEKRYDSIIVMKIAIQMSRASADSSDAKLIVPKVLS